MLTPDIKIFVSHRIDINSELIDNPIYVPVRCGAAFDRENPVGIAGDDTGENISERRMSFCEFTVQYWAWKNAEADYYGLCHYRRYLSFADARFKTDEYGMVFSSCLLPGEKKRFGLLNAKKMQQIICDYDVIVSESTPVSNIPTSKGKLNTVCAMWDALFGEYFDGSFIDLLFSLIDKITPEYSQSAREYLAGDMHRGYNCYVLKKELFLRMCEFQFSIMFEVERKLDTTGCTQTMLRTPAFFGEMLYGIFIYHVTAREHCRVKELQLIFFRNADRIKGRSDYIKRVVGSCVNRSLRIVVDPILPKGSKQRETLKNIYYTLTRAKRRGAAEVKLTEESGNRDGKAV